MRTVSGPGKTTLKALAFLLLLLTSCGRSDAERIREYNLALETINDNLALINQKEGVIVSAGSSVEGVYDAAGSRKIETAITANLRAIDSAMSSSRRELDLLREKLSSGSRTIQELQKTVANLQTTLDLKEKEIQRLRKELERSHLSIARLTDSLNTVFYIAAPEDSLKRWRIMRKKGGFLGIVGGTRRLDENLSLQRFARLDRNRATRIPVPARKGDFRLVTTHKRDSYAISRGSPTAPENMRLSYLVILDPARFWAVSNLLVIELDD